MPSAGWTGIWIGHPVTPRSRIETRSPRDVCLTLLWFDTLSAAHRLRSSELRHLETKTPGGRG